VNAPTARAKKELMGAAVDPAAPAVEFQNVTKDFTNGKETFRALSDVSLSIQPGEIFGLVGYSGAGKSTLLRTVNALERPTSGKVFVHGREISALRGPKLYEARQGIGMVFQQFNLLNSRTLYNNIAYPLRVAKTPEPQIVDRVEELLDFVGLTDKALQYPSHLSGGQKQRVGIARALATQPDILISDEATSALDPQTTDEVLDLLSRTNKEFGVTTLVVTHEIDVIRKIANRVAVMERGSVIEQGSVYDVFSDPQTPTARRFVSSVLDHVPSDDALVAIRAAHRGRLVRVRVEDGNADPHLLSRVARETGADLAVVYGGVSQLQGRLFGSLMIELVGSDVVVDSAIERMRSLARVEEVRHA
jgi:D-methionine transport system ATP-binding protein